MRHITIIIGLLLSSVTIAAQNTTQDAMQAALDRLEKAQKNVNSREEADALCDIATCDLKESLDAEAEKYAILAEEIARNKKFDDILARALIIKANICAYAETDDRFNRNDEGLRYAHEALVHAQTSGVEKLVMESCCSISQLYVNKNRWNKILNREWYSLAGDYLDHAERISESHKVENMPKLIAFRMRYFRQGHQIARAIEYCERAFGMCGESDNVLKAQLCDHLTALYIESGNYEAVADAHSAYVHYSTLNARMSEAEKLQEMQAKYEMELKQAMIQKKTYQVLFLAVAAILLSILAFMLHLRNNKEKRLRIQAEENNLIKQELIEFISKDLKNPLNSGRNELEQFAQNARKMSEEEIAVHAQKLIAENQHLSHDVAEYVSDIIISRNKMASNFGLSEREIEIIRLSSQGLKASEIAEKLFISTRTVSNHKANIYSKMGVNSNAEMCRTARENGII